MLDRESACNRAFSGPSLCFGSSLLVRFQAGRCPEIDNVVTAALLPDQPDQLRRRHDRYDNGERAMPLDVPATNGTKRKFFNDFSRACARVRATDGPFGLPFVLLKKLIRNNIKIF